MGGRGSGKTGMGFYLRVHYGGFVYISQLMPKFGSSQWRFSLIPRPSPSFSVFHINIVKPGNGPGTRHMEISKWLVKAQIIYWIH